MIWRTRALFHVLDALAQGIGATGIKGQLAIWGIGRVTNVNTGAIFAILFFFAILVSSTAWQAFATLAYFSPLLAVIVVSACA